LRDESGCRSAQKEVLAGEAAQGTIRSQRLQTWRKRAEEADGLTSPAESAGLPQRDRPKPERDVTVRFSAGQAKLGRLALQSWMKNSVPIRAYSGVSSLRSTYLSPGTRIHAVFSSYLSETTATGAVARARETEGERTGCTAGTVKAEAAAKSAKSVKSFMVCGISGAEEEEGAHERRRGGGRRT
jgi:hypothetical protein